jgi:hypothetical protein
VAKKIVNLMHPNIALIILVFIGTLLRFRGVDRSLNEMFSFRQTQTAWGAKSILNFDAKFLHPEVPVLGPPFEIPFEFPLFQWLHVIFSKIFEEDIDKSGRILALLIFQCAVIMTYLIVRNLFNATVGVLVAFVVEFNSFNVQWGFAVLIDYLSVLLFLLGIYFILKNRFQRNYLLIGLSLITIATCVKLTTYVVFIPLIIYILSNKVIKHKIQIMLIFVANPIIFSYLWSVYADSIKNDNPYTVWLMSKNLISWNFGTISQRLDPPTYLRLINRHEDLILGIPLLLVVVLVLFYFNNELISKKHKWLTLSLILGSILGPIVFINLYFVHDYYMIANNIIVTTIVVVVIYNLIRLYSKRFFRLQTIFLLTFCVFSTWVSPLGIDYFYNLASKPEDGERSKMLNSNTKESDLILALGCNGWDPTLFYYADRRGHMKLNSEEEPQNFNKYSAIIKCNDNKWEDSGNWIQLSDWKIINSELLVRK